MHEKLSSRTENSINGKPFCEQSIREEIGGIEDIEIFFFDEIDSTNLHARRLIMEGKRAPFLVVANSQSAGRGRLGRAFYSPADSGLYMSIALEAGSTDIGITTRASVALCRAIDKVCAVYDTKIKWVNDVYLYDRKIAGILAESLEDTNGDRVFIIGIGVNVSTKDFPPEIRDIAASLGTDNSVRSKLCAAMTEEIFSLLAEDGKCMDEYRERSLVLGRDVSYFINGQQKLGRACAILDSGALEILTPDGSFEILGSGEISLRVKSADV